MAEANCTMPNVANNPLNDGVLSQDLLKCRAQNCNNVGDCVIQDGLQVCKCLLGYRGHSCQETVNDGLAVPLTLGVLGFIVGFIVLAFILAFVQQRKRERLWKQTDEKREELKKNGGFPHTKIGLWPLYCNTRQNLN
ncbi:hypothetical protein AMELA_G00144880 [Ameiurus melas]|uniref:EGF-like domain-containing protein n=1 Tax=Ameiurus melas TaxID=219545 RepID=A0A7J6AG94_AMEME|nr:hypothetical protein AMELA_G00144880 [Ameiurus melas]